MTRALDLASLQASPEQRRTAFIAIGALTALAVAAGPFVRLQVGVFPGFVTLYGGAVIMALAITCTILFGQFAVSRKPSLLALACGMLFSTIIFVPYILTFPGVSTALILGALGNTATWLWLVWHAILPASFAAYAWIGRREGAVRVGPADATATVVATIVAAYAVIHLIFAFDDVLPPLVIESHYQPIVYASLATTAIFAAVALGLLFRSRGTVIDLWLTVPASAMLLEALVNGLSGTRYSLGWYLARLDILVASTFLVVTLIIETNRLARLSATSERRFRGIVDGVADALIVVDASGAVASMNPAAALLFGHDPRDVAGTPIARMIPDYGALDAPDGSTLHTLGQDAEGRTFPIELRRSREATAELGESIIIVRDVSERKSAEDAVRAAHDRAIEAAEVKSQFLATMSHEIRTPINAVVGMAELLLQTPLDEEGREYAVVVRDSAESLLAIVNDILDFSKIEAGRMELDEAPFAPVVAIENATDILAAAARKKGLSLATYVAQDVPRRVLGDADRLRQVLLNLVGNAVKFTAQGSVTVRAVVERTDGDYTVLRFAITDTGPGIAPEVAERLFEPFRQADQTTRRRFGGTGLGLSISRRLVELMGGRIGFDSAPGRGSTFWFTVRFLRVSEDAPAERGDALRGARVLIIDEDAVTRQVVDQYLMSWGAVASSTANAAHAFELAKAASVRQNPFDVVVVDRQAGGDGVAFVARLRGEPALSSVPVVLLSGGDEPTARADLRARGFAAVVRKPIRQSTLHGAIVGAIRGTSGILAEPEAVLPEAAAAASALARNVRVLIAEDNPVNRKLALQQLKKLGYTAEAVEDGRLAVEAVAAGNFDMVLMDVQMPELDGYEATREIRASGSRIPIVAMTANALEGDREVCISAGMDDYLAKPVQLAALRGVIERFTGGVIVGG